MTVGSSEAIRASAASPSPASLDELELVIAGERRGDPEPEDRFVVDDQNSHGPPVGCQTRISLANSAELQA